MKRIKEYKRFRKREMKVVIVGISKTIDNDIGIDHSFKFESSIEQAVKAIYRSEFSKKLDRISQVIW